MAKAKHASFKPSEAIKGGGKFGFPNGSVVTITAAVCTTWGEAADENALKGGRAADDPCLKLTGDVDGIDEPRDHVLGAGKAVGLQPTEDGEFFDGEGIVEGSNTNVFLDSLCDKKLQGKNALDEDIFDNGMSALVGLKFVAGSKRVERDFADSDDKKKNRPTLIATEILELPGTKKSKKKKVEEEEEEEQPKKKKKVVEEEEEEPPVKKKKPAAKESDDDDSEDLEDAAEAAVVAVLKNPKYRKGLPTDKAYTSVYVSVKGDDNGEKIVEGYVNREKWMQSGKRPWEYDAEAELYTLP